MLGITTADVMAEYWKWRKLVFLYPSSEQYPWPKPVYYHICLELRRRGIDGQLSHKELEREAGEIMNMWERRVVAGSRFHLFDGRWPRQWPKGQRLQKFSKPSTSA